MTTLKRPEALTDKETHYCAGCGHGIVHRLIAEVVDEMKIRESVIGMAPVGCAVIAYDYWNFDVSEAAHGRTPAVATGIKRANPDCVVFSYQGDGDLAAIGTAETIHAANRGELITIIFVNNGVYGMTGGQMAPTTMIGQKTTTTPKGRDPLNEGPPLKVCELLSAFDRVAYVERTTVAGPKDIRRTKAAIAHAFETQQKKLGFSMVEILSPCPTYWRKSPADSLEHIKNVVSVYFPTKIFKDWRENA